MRELISRVSPGRAGTTRKTIQNARSEIEFVLRFYGLTHLDSFKLPLTPQFQLWHDRLDKYRRLGLTRLFRFASARGMGPAEVDDLAMDQFRMVLEAELPARAASGAFAAAVRAWNQLPDLLEEWPGSRLRSPCNSRRWALAWTEFPSSLKADVDAFYADRERNRGPFSSRTRSRLAPSTIRRRKEHLRTAASELCSKDGIDPATLTRLRDLCRPERYRRALILLIERSSGRVTGYIEQVAITLKEVAVECGELSDRDVEELRRDHADLYQQRKLDKRDERHPDQNILDLLDDESTMNGLISIAEQIAARVRRLNRPDRKSALLFQCATAVELLLAAPLRITNLSRLHLDQHIGRVRVNGAERVVIRIPGTETKNGKPIEHYLHAAAARLLDEYAEVYRPMLVSEASPWLFPGCGGGPKHAQVLGRQLKRLIHEELGLPFHAHIMRKVVVKIILDEDPAAIEIARLQLGHSDPRALQSAYRQQHNRKAQETYLTALKNRQLAALNTFDSVRNKQPRPLRVGKGPRQGNCP